MLRSCYQGTWRLFRNSPKTTRGQYYFAPPNTPFYPGAHNVWSLNWVTDDLDGSPPLGEQFAGRRPYSKGTAPANYPPAVLLGDADCVAGGDTFPLPMVTRTIPYGYDSRCWMAKSKTPPASPMPPPTWWLKSEDIPGSNDGDPVAYWNDASGYGRNALQLNPAAQPFFAGGGPGGFNGCVFLNNHVLVVSPALDLGQSNSVYIVATLLSTFGARTFGPMLIPTIAPSFGAPDINASRMRYVASPDNVQLPYSASSGATLIWSLRRQPDSVILTAGNLASDSFDLPGKGGVSVAGLTVIQVGTPSLRETAVYEIVAYDWTLDVDSHNSVISYLSNKYSL